MKKLTVACVAAIGGAVSAGGQAGVVPHYLFANGVVADHIGVLQHSVVQGAMDGFSGNRMYSVGRPAIKRNVESVNMDVYGKMPVYGEYGDDGTVFGHSGGDFGELNNAWLSWRYDNGYVKFDDFANIDVDSNVVTAGLTSFSTDFGTLGLFAGYVNANQKNDEFDITGNGGYFGIYDGMRFGRFNLSVVADGGVLFNENKSSVFGTDNFTNIWLGAGLNAGYDIVIDDSFVIQPNAYAGYTWVRTPDYISASGVDVSSDNLSVFEVTPGIRLVKNVVGDWFGVANVKYVMNFNDGGVVEIADVSVDELSRDDYMEYSLGIEKHISGFDLSVNAGRRDGGYTGWIFGASAKYVF